jgi:c(7)-type cytochrome triheme protein
MLQRLKLIKEQIRGFVTRRPKLTILIIIGIFAFFTFISVEALHFTSTPQFCKYCHPSDKPGPLGEVAAWEKSKHAKAGVSCLDCHAQPGLVGYLKAKVSALPDVYREFLGDPQHKMHILMLSSDPKYAAKLVQNDICMFCHTDSMNQKVRGDRIMSLGHAFRKLDGVKNPEFRKSVGLPDIIAEGVRPTTDVDPKHKMHFEKGMNCVDCHLKIAHSGEMGYKSSMSICFSCHDQKRKEKLNPPDNGNCTACHRKNEGLYPKEAIPFGKGSGVVKFEHETHVSMLGCNACHDKPFAMKKASTKIGFADHAAGRNCFSCHDGKKAFNWSSCASCHAKPPAPKAAIVYKAEGVAPVAFSHDFHAQAFACSACHTKIWAMKRGPSMKMDPMYEGKLCGVCHSEKGGAFAATDCDRCHIEPKK